MKKSSQRARMYRRFSAAASWLPQKPLAFLRALWLGLLDAETLNQVTHAGYENQGQDGFASVDFNSQGFWPWELASVQTYFAGCRHVLVAGAGGGREAIALARLGFDVTAFDFCSELTAACRRNLALLGLAAHVHDAPADRIPDGLPVFDGILVGRGFYHHIPGRRQRVAFLEQCRAHLQADAPLVLSDFFARPDQSAGYQRTRAIANGIRWLRGCSERVELGDWLSDSMQHAFVQSEIDSELTAAGFTPVAYAASPVSEGSALAHAAARSTARLPN